MLIHKKILVPHCYKRLCYLIWTLTITCLLPQICRHFWSRTRVLDHIPFYRVSFCSLSIILRSTRGHPTHEQACPVLTIYSFGVLFVAWGSTLQVTRRFNFVFRFISIVVSSLVAMISRFLRNLFNASNMIGMLAEIISNFSSCSVLSELKY